MTFWLENKKISKAEAIALFGQASVDKIIKEAKMIHEEDPHVALSWFMGRHGMLDIII